MGCIKTIIVIMGLMILSLESYGQQILEDNVVQKIKYIEDDSFDSLFVPSTDKLMCHIREKIGTRWGDSLFILDLKRHINPSLTCIFIRGYWLGRASVFFKDGGSEFLSKKAGVKEVLRLYRQIQRENQSFHIRYLDIVTRYDSLQFSDLVRSFNDSASIGAIDPGLAAAPEKVASSPLYGRSPDYPIQVGTNFNEKDYLYGLRSGKGGTISFKLVHTACSENFYNKVTGAYALLDKYKVKIKHTNKTVYLYFDFYHNPERKEKEKVGHLFIPEGFTFKKRR